MIGLKKEAQKELRQPYDCLVEWHLSLCFQQKCLPPGGSTRYIRDGAETLNDAQPYANSSGMGETYAKLG
jgi:hypothetical protein